MMPCVSFHNTACFTYTPTPTHTNTYTPTHSHTHTQGFSSPPHSNLLPVWELSSSRLDWHKLNTISLNLLQYLPLASQLVRDRAPDAGRETSKRHPPHVPPPPPTPPNSPVVRAVSIRQPARFGRRAAPWSPAVCLELRCLLSASPATRKAVYGDTQCEKGADLKRRRMQARTTKVSYSKVYASPLLSSTP